MTVRTSVLWKISTHMAKKWPGMVVQRTFIKGHSFVYRLYEYKVKMGLRLFFFPNFPGTMFIQGATFIPDSRVGEYLTMNFIHFLFTCNAFWCEQNFFVHYWTIQITVFCNRVFWKTITYSHRSHRIYFLVKIHFRLN